MSSNGLKVLGIAKAEIGTTETPANSNKQKYGKWFGYNGVAWCAIFVSWCYNFSGFPLGKIGYTKGMAGCMTGVNHFRSTGEVTATPQAGDIVFFDFNKDGRWDHVGLFVRGIDKDTFETIEGNTGLKNDSNGGEVMTRVRKYSTALFVHPKVLDAA